MRRRRSTFAFTIVELLVAAAISAAIVALLGTMFGSLATAASRANQRIDAFRDARAALQMMQRDFSGLVRTQWDVKTTPVPTPPPTSITRPAAYLAMSNLYADPAVGATTPNQQIYALIAAKNSGRGDVCSVGYYCRWDASRHTYSLRRLFADSQATHANFTKAAVAAANYASSANLYVPSATDDVVASYVWNLRITAYDPSGAEVAYPYVCDSSATGYSVPPASIEISFRAISSDATNAITASSIGADVWMNDTDPAYKRLIQPHTYEFRTRIPL